MSWDLIKTLWELVQLLSFYSVMAGCAVTGIAFAVALVCWVIDYIRKELGR
jgi:hypothetical protein